MQPASELTSEVSGPSSVPLLRAVGWGWRHAGRRAWAVQGVDLTVAAGERVLLLGPSGGGKSTFLTGVAGLLDDGPDGTGESRGTLDVSGVPARRARERAVAAGGGRAATGLLLQDPQAQTVLARVGDDVAFGLENHGVPRSQIWPRVDEAVAALRLGLPRAHPTARLSGGQRQRLALAGVLALRPGLLLLDEPTSMLDPGGADSLRAAVAELMADRSRGCLIVEHRVADWVDLVDRVVVLTPDGVVADGSPEQVLRREATRLAAAGVWVPGRSSREPMAARRRPPVEAEPLLRLRSVTVNRRGLPAPVLRGVDLDVHPGRVLALTGPNGAGKSTLSSVLAGLVRPGAGTVAAGAALAAGAGSDPTRWRPRQLVARIGSVFQDPRHQFVASTVAAELAVGPQRAGWDRARIDDRVTDLLERLGLVALAAANPFTLSGGEQRRLSVATALATEPAMLVLDEPTFGQDARTWQALVALLDQARDDGAAVVVATHDADLVNTIADEVRLVGDGRVLRVGGPDGGPREDPVGGRIDGPFECPVVGTGGTG